MLPHCYEEYFYSVYYRDCVTRETPAGHVASLSYFLHVWRTELPWVKLRAPSGPFTHCGLCDFMRMIISATQDSAVKNKLLLRLGDHYQFQAAQRIAASNMFATSQRDPSTLLAVSWDKMDQAKNIIPRVKSLSNTQFMKGGTRLVVSLVGVLCPSVTQRPIFYTVLEDQVQGSDMICSLLIDVLIEAAGALGQLPRHFFIQADNTPKETKNTITLFAAVWLLCQLRDTRLESIEFGYLVVGHTHDLIDATFAYVSKAVHGQDILSMPNFFSALSAKMKNPPMWKHLRDVFQFKENQPDYLSSRHIHGIALPNNLRVSRGRSGEINVQTKRWMTSPTWSDPVILCKAAQVEQLRGSFFPCLQPEWPKGFETSAMNWLTKLKNLLAAAGKDVGPLSHCERVVRHQLPEYLPTGDTLQDKIAKLRRIGRDRVPLALTVDLESTVSTACLAAFPGSAGSMSNADGLLRIAGGVVGKTSFREGPMQAGILCLYRPRQLLTGMSVSSMPIRLGRVLRVADDVPSSPFVVVESWWPLAKPEKFGNKLNLFGTWVAGPQPLIDGAPLPKKPKSAGANGSVANQVLVELVDVLVWPVDVDRRCRDEGVRIPFDALHYLRAAHGINVATHLLTFSKRGEAFLSEACVRDARMARTD